ncbi:hypothetical protein B484DRAFT_203686 [Ochromonadaceae sp. CCMP2298]|nr:hypothetical protein B484DRAFT_203686 [Ochromonadaceae sp. CCMP2298]
MYYVIIYYILCYYILCTMLLYTMYCVLCAMADQGTYCVPYASYVLCAMCYVLCAIYNYIVKKKCYLLLIVYYVRHTNLLLLPLLCLLYPLLYPIFLLYPLFFILQSTPSPSYPCPTTTSPWRWCTSAHWRRDSGCACETTHHCRSRL